MFMVMVLLTISFASAYMEQYNNSDFWITKNLWGQTGGTDVGGNNGEGLDSAFIMGFEAPYNMNVSEICVASSTTFTGEQIMRIGVVNWVAGHPDYGDNYSDITDYRAIGWTTVNVGESDSWVCANVTTQYLMQKNSNYALVYMYNESSGVRYGYPGMINGYSADGNNDHYMAGFSGGRGAVEDDNIFNFSVYGPSRTSHAGFAFKLTNGSAWGHPIYDNYYFDGDYPNIRDNYTYAQIFVPSQDISPKKVSSRFYVRDEDTTEGMTLEIRNSTNDILTSCQLNRSITDFQTCTLDSQSERLFLGETYYLTYTCYNCDNDADGSTYIMRGTSINKYGENNQAPAWLVNATSGGDTSYLVFSNNNGTTWQDRDGGKFDGSTFNIEYTSNSDNEPPLTEIDINMTNVFSGDTVSVTGIFNRTELAFNPGYEVYLDTCWLVNGSGSTIYSEVIGNEKNWTCNYDITITGEKDDTFDFTWYVNDTVGNINSATDTVSIVIQQYDVTNITQSWIRYIDAINDTTTITATVVGNYDVTNDVDVIFKINGTTVCTNSTTVLGTTPINVDCTYTTEDNIAMIEVSTNYTGSDSSRMLGIWKEHPFLMGVDYQEQKAILENSSHPWNSKYISWVNDCENYRN